MNTPPPPSRKRAQRLAGPAIEPVRREDHDDRLLPHAASAGIAANARAGHDADVEVRAFLGLGQQRARQIEARWSTPGRPPTIRTRGSARVSATLKRSLSAAYPSAIVDRDRQRARLAGRVERHVERRRRPESSRAWPAAAGRRRRPSRRSSRGSRAEVADRGDDATLPAIHAPRWLTDRFAAGGARVADLELDALRQHRAVCRRSRCAADR